MWGALLQDEAGHPASGGSHGGLPCFLNWKLSKLAKSQETCCYIWWFATCYKLLSWHRSDTGFKWFQQHSKTHETWLHVAVWGLPAGSFPACAQEHQKFARRQTMNIDEPRQGPFARLKKFPDLGVYQPVSQSCKPWSFERLMPNKLQDVTRTYSTRMYKVFLFRGWSFPALTEASAFYLRFLVAGEGQRCSSSRGDIWRHTNHVDSFCKKEGMRPKQWNTSWVLFH